MRTVGILKDLSANAFRSVLSNTQPVRLPKRRYAEGHNALPALKKWFLRPINQNLGPRTLNSSYLDPYVDSTVPVEWTRHAPQGRNRRPIASFSRVELPLRVFVEIIVSQLDNQRKSESRGLTDDNFYLAQCPIQSLDANLQKDLPTPDFVLQAGRGDVYENSIWLGVTPTYTPIHKDPNPNFFVQIAGCKVVRLFEPHFGLAIFRQASQELQHGGLTKLDEDMMQGEQREALHQLTWENETVKNSDQAYEVSLDPGDSVFIPKGWWHSLRGIGDGINGSVNWWFR